MNKRLTREACIKIIEQAERTEAEFADCFTAAVTGDSMHDIYKVRYSRWPSRQKCTAEAIKFSQKHLKETSTIHFDSFDDKAGSIILIG